MGQKQEESWWTLIQVEEISDLKGHSVTETENTGFVYKSVEALGTRRISDLLYSQ